MRNKCDNCVHNVLSDELIIGYLEGDDLRNDRNEYCNIWDNCNDFKPLKK